MDFFNEFGARGWKLISASPIAGARWGNPENNTTRLLFVFKRHKACSTAVTPEHPTAP